MEIDHEHLEKYVVGDDALRDEILMIFQEQVSTILDQFDVHADDDTWTDTAHLLKGTARGVGAWALGDLCAEAMTLIEQTENLRSKREEIIKKIRESGNAAVEYAGKIRSEAA